MPASCKPASLGISKEHSKLELRRSYETFRVRQGVDISLAESARYSWCRSLRCDAGTGPIRTDHNHYLSGRRGAQQRCARRRERYSVPDWNPFEQTSGFDYQSSVEIR